MYIFNPDNDLALAHFGQYYTPPAAARTIAADLAMLPAWYADHEPVVALSSLNQQHLAEMQRLLPITASLTSLHQIKDHPNCTLKPWGWNPALKQMLIDAGVSETMLPTTEHLLLIRRYSNRKNAVILLKQLSETSEWFCGESHHFVSHCQVMQFLDSTSGDKALKMPWSGSGKGLIWIKGDITDKQQDWCRRVIKQQGGVVAEPQFDKVQDLAMEFRMTNGCAQFVAHSLFTAAPSGAYMGNELLSEQSIVQRIGQYINVAVVDGLKEQLLQLLPQMFPLYNGYLGVDMMICRCSDGHHRLHPCVEINLRMNMGLVAHHIRQRYLHSASTGHYRVAYFPRKGEAMHHIQTMRAAHPLQIQNNRITHGYLNLTPADENTQYTAEIMMNYLGE